MKNSPEQRNQKFKEKAALLSWVTGLLLIISALWIFTQPLQASNLMRSVNNVFKYNDDTRRLSGFINMKSGKAAPLGYWFTIYNSSDKMFVFGVFQNGILIPLGAVVSANGAVNEVIPLSAHAVQVFGDISDSVMQVYVNRIEKAAAREGVSR